MTNAFDADLSKTSTDNRLDGYGVTIDHLKAQLQAESNFDPWAVSRVGALGIAQFMPATCKWLGLDAPFNPAASIAKQGWYMGWICEHLLTAFHDLQDVPKWAFAAYNWGIGNIMHTLSTMRQAGAPLVYDDNAPGIPKETRDYVRRIVG